MTQATQRSLLNEEAYVNPRHAEDAAKLAEHDKAILETQDQGTTDTAPVEQPVHNWEKRYKDLQSYNSRMINEMKGTIKDLQVQGTPKLAVPKTPEEMMVFKEANPETYAVIETMAANIAQSQMATYDARLAQVNGDLMDTKIDRAALALKDAHPDYEAIVADDAFHEWAKAQSTDIQDWIYNNPDEPSKAIQAISLYKYSKGQSQSNVQHDTNVGNTDGSMDVNVRNASAPEASDRNHPAYKWRESDIGKMHPDEFAKWEEVIMLAHREGRVLIGQ